MDALRLEAMSLGTKGWDFRLASLRACRRAGWRIIVPAYVLSLARAKCTPAPVDVESAV
jgi:hypothetical protein